MYPSDLLHFGGYIEFIQIIGNIKCVNFGSFSRDLGYNAVKLLFGNIRNLHLVFISVDICLVIYGVIQRIIGFAVHICTYSFSYVLSVFGVLCAVGAGFFRFVFSYLNTILSQL